MFFKPNDDEYSFSKVAEEIKRMSLHKYLDGVLNQIFTVNWPETLGCQGYLLLAFAESIKQRVLPETFAAATIGQSAAIEDVATQIVLEAKEAYEKERALHPKS